MVECESGMDTAGSECGLSFENEKFGVPGMGRPRGIDTQHGLVIAFHDEATCQSDSGRLVYRVALGGEAHGLKIGFSGFINTIEIHQGAALEKNRHGMRGGFG